MDSVADAVHSIAAEAENALPATSGGRFSEAQGIEHLEKEIALTLLPSLLLFGGAATALGLVVYFFINLSDCQEDLINPYTLCERINSKLHWELIAHATAVGALVLEELIDGDRLHWVAMLLAMPGFALRLLWFHQKKLKIDATEVFHPRFAGRLKTRWGLMCLWHGLTVLFAFVQLVMHMVLGLHANMPHTMRTLGEHHLRRAQQMQQMGPLVGMGHHFGH